MQPARTHTQATLIPGIALALTLALGARLLAGSQVSPVLCAVLIGIFWRNVIGTGENVEAGLRWVMQRLLTVGIALVGMRLTLGGLTSVALSALPIVVACIATAFIVAHVVGRTLRIAPTLRHFIAVGTAVCGCTAVVASASVLRARPSETGFAITCIVLFGCFGMLLYPWLAHALIVARPQAVGIFLGTAIHDTSQVIGAAAIYAKQFEAPEVVPIASATKFLRNLSLLLFIPLSAFWARTSEAADSTATIGRSTLWNAVPGYVIAFVLLMLARTAGDALLTGAQLWDATLSMSQVACDLLLTCGMTAVGLSVPLDQIRDLGWRPIVTAFLTAVATAACSLVLCASGFRLLIRLG